MVKGSVQCIFLASAAGSPMHAVEEALAIAGQGLEGDRYAANEGSWSKVDPLVTRQATLIALQAIEDANAGREEAQFLPSDTRRNIVIAGILPDELNELVGKKFAIGQVVMCGIERSDPCRRPSKLSGKPGFEERFQNKGGIRTEILNTGNIRIGDCLIAH